MSNYLVGGGDSTISINRLAPNSNLVGISDTQTLTNKLLDNSTVFHTDTTDPTKRIRLQTSAAGTGTTTILESKQTVNRTVTLPDANDTLVGKNTTDVLTNKTLTNPIIGSINNGGIVSFPTSTDTLVGRATTDTLTNKSLDNATVFHVDTTDNTKKVGFQSSTASTGTILTIASAQTTSQTLQVPNLVGTDTVVTTNAPQTISGTKSLTSVSSLVSQNSTLYNTGTASQSANTVTGVGTVWTSSMVGGLINFANGIKAFITAFVSSTSLTVAVSQTVTSQAYSLYYGGTQIGPSGNIGNIGQNISSLTASQAVVSDANKNLTSLPYTIAATSSSLVQRDINANTFTNNLVNSYATTLTAAGTTTLTVASAHHQYFTGTSTQTVVLPDVTTLVLGFEFNIVNNSTNSVTVQSSGGNVIGVLAPDSYATLQCVLTSGNTAASWNILSPNEASMVPSSPSTDIGSSAQPYRNLYLSGAAIIGGSPAIVAKYIAYGTATVNNTIVETGISPSSNIRGSLLFSNPQAIGAAISLDLGTTVTSAMGDVLTIRHKVNGTTIFTHTINVPSAANLLNVDIKSHCVIQSSTIQIKSTRIVGNTPTTVKANVPYNYATDNAWSVTAQWGSNVNSLTMDQLIVDARFLNTVSFVPP